MSFAAVGCGTVYYAIWEAYPKRTTIATALGGIALYCCYEAEQRAARRVAEWNKEQARRRKEQASKDAKQAENDRHARILQAIKEEDFESCEQLYGYNGMYPTNDELKTAVEVKTRTKRVQILRIIFVTCARRPNILEPLNPKDLLRREGLSGDTVQDIFAAGVPFDDDLPPAVNATDALHGLLIRTYADTVRDISATRSYRILPRIATDTVHGLLIGTYAVAPVEAKQQNMIGITRSITRGSEVNSLSSTDWLNNGAGWLDHMKFATMQSLQTTPLHLSTAPPLFCAILIQNQEAIQNLHNHNADVNMVFHSCTLLGIAIEWGSPEAVKKLLEMGANVNVKHYGHHPLHLALNQMNYGYGY